jgi:hypothetical protein
MTAASQQWLPPAQVLLQIEKQGCHSCDRIVVRLITTYIQSVTVTTKVVSFNHAHGEMYTKQHYIHQNLSEKRRVVPTHVTMHSPPKSYFLLISYKILYLFPR